MIVNNDTNSRGRPNARQMPLVLRWQKFAHQPTSHASKRRRRILVIMSMLLLVMLIFAVVRFTMFAGATNEQLLVQIGNQQVAPLDLRQSLPISPDLFGANTFPQIGTRSLDQANGTMYYSPPFPKSLADAHIKLLRYPGGSWGEEHTLSLAQLSDFSTLLQQVHADGMLQVRLSGPIGGNFTALQDLTSRVNVAGRWVDFMNNPRSDQRIGKYAHAPFHPIKFWAVGNEPDKLIDPTTGHTYTVMDYVNDFIKFSTVMHQNDPMIQVFGPEISQFYGPGAGPSDPQGQLWMEGFLKGVGTYEQRHPELKFHLLDGISFHHYQSLHPGQDPSLLLSSTDEWNYLLPLLHQLMGQYLKRNVPIAITEINTNPPGQQAPSPGLAALWWADTLGTLMNSQVEYAVFASASGVNIPYPLFTTQNLHPTPMFRVMQIFSHLQPNLIPLQVQREPISLYATEDDMHQTVSLLFINKANTPQLAQISPANSPFAVSPWHGLSVSLAGDSMVVITLHRDGDAEADSYIVPASDDASTTPVIHTNCGSKDDPLDNTIPC